MEGERGRKGERRLISSTLRCGCEEEDVSVRMAGGFCTRCSTASARVERGASCVAQASAGSAGRDICEGGR